MTGVAEQASNFLELGIAGAALLALLIVVWLFLRHMSQDRIVLTLLVNKVEAINTNIVNHIQSDREDHKRIEDAVDDLKDEIRMRPVASSKSVEGVG